MRERTILDQLVDHARERVAEAKKKIPFEKMKQMALEMAAKEPVRDAFAFEKALRRPELSFICECKKASPSKGLIAPDFPYLEIAKEYEKAGADCISVLTESQMVPGKRPVSERDRCECIDSLSEKGFRCRSIHDL